MAQLININSTEFRRCNLSAIQSGGTWANLVPDENEIILISTTNALTAVGSGECDAYIVGDATTAATALELKPILDKTFINKTFTAVVEQKFWLNAVSTDADYGKEVAVDDNSYYVTDYIDVKGFSEITFTVISACRNRSIYNKGGYVFYDDEKNPILGVNTIKYGAFAVKEYTLSIPNNAVYIRWTANTNHDYTIKGKVDILTPYSIVNNLEDGGAESPLSAEMGKRLNERTFPSKVIKTAKFQYSNAWLNALSTDANFGEVTTMSASTTANYKVTEYISIVNVSKIYLKVISTTGIAAAKNKGGIVFYDSDKVALHGIVTIGSGNSYTEEYKTVDVPSDAVYMRNGILTTLAQVDIECTLSDPIANGLFKSDIVDNLVDGGVDKALSAEQGKILLENSSYIDNQDTSLFSGASQNTSAITIEKNGNDWIITKLGSTNYTQAGLLITSIPANKEFNWEIEYSTTSTTNNAARFATNINAQQATTKSVCTFTANASHAIVSFKATREDYSYFAVTSSNMSNASSLTIHSIKVYSSSSVQELGEEMKEALQGVSKNYEDVTVLYNDKKPLVNSLKHSSDAFSCLLFSDIHGDSIALSRIMKLYSAWNDEFNCVINAGDTNKNNSSENTEWYWGTIDSLTDKQVLLALGNHDAWRSSANDNVCDKEEYDAWILPLSTRISGLVKPANADTLLLPYYYKDYGNIRVIVLSTYTNKLSSDLAWFTDTLADAVTNSKKVIVVEHLNHSIAARRGTTIQQRLVEDGDYNNGFKSYLNGDSLQGYVDSPSNDTDNIGNGFVVAVKTFMDNGGTFITWINGHIHHDYFTDLSGTTHEATCGKQAFIALSTARADYQNDNPKTWPDGTGMDSFYAFSVDETLGVFKLMKFGSETDYAMRPRKFLAYSYVEHKIVAQS